MHSVKLHLNGHLFVVFVRWCSSLLDRFWFIKTSKLTSNNDEETDKLARAPIIFSSCALLFGLKGKGRNSALVQGYMQSRKYGTDAPGVCPFGWSLTHTDTEYWMRTWFCRSWTISLLICWFCRSVFCFETFVDSSSVFSRCNSSSIDELLRTDSLGYTTRDQLTTNVHIWRVPKNRHIFVRLTTSSSSDQFSNFFHYQNREKICTSTIIKYPITPQVACQCLKSNNWKQDVFCNDTFLRVRRPAAWRTQWTYDVKTAGCNSYFRQ